MTLRFLDPLALLLLLLLPLFVLRWRRLKGLSAPRRWTALGLRLVIALLLILALTRVQFQKKTDLVAVMFVLDLSESIPEEQRHEAFETIRQAVAVMGPKDQAGVVVFGRDAVLDQPAQPYLVWDRPNSVFNAEGTNLAAALRLGLAALPVESQKRIVLFSDGNQNRGSVIEEVRRLAGLGIPIDVFPLSYRNDAEVFVERMIHPNAVNEEEPVSLDVFVRSRTATAARLRLFVENQLLREEPVQLEPGKNKFTVRSLHLPGSQLSKLEVRVEAQADTNQENNKAAGFVNVRGRPNILILEGDLREDPNASLELVAQLESEGIRVTRTLPEDFSNDVSQILAYDGIVLSNVAADDLSAEQMATIERGVHEMGLGLVMVGGDKSFGAGGYRETPIEKALPVSMDITERKILPTGALAVVLHTCEIPSGNDWMRKIAIESIRVLDEKDEVGMLDYGLTLAGGGVKWIFPLDYKEDGRRQVALIKQANPGDMPDFGTAMKLGYNSLRQARSNLRHMVILSDGDPSPPSMGLLAQFQKAGITVSTVLIGGHGMNFREVMRTIASQTGGKFYDVKSPSALPRIFAREAARVKRNLIVEETFKPNQVGETELTESFEADSYPALLGYVITTRKEQAEVPLVTHQEDPLLAHWRYGLGKSIAFTSDFKRKWAPAWIEWSGFGAYWAQAIRWVSRNRLEGDYRLQVFQEEGKGRVVLDAFDEDGKPINFLEFEGKTVAPDQSSGSLRLVQTDLGRYEAEFDIDQEGTYLVNLSPLSEADSQEKAMINAGLAVPYSPEFSNDTSNLGLLQQIADVGHGRMTPSVGSLFDRNLSAHAKPIPVWPFLLALAVILFWFDVFVRRVLLDWNDVRAGAILLAAFLRPPRAATSTTTLDRLKEVKAATEKKGPIAPVAPPSGETSTATPPPKYDFDSLESKEPAGVDLEKPSGRKAAPTKKESEVTPPREEGPDRPPRTTERLLDLKRRIDKDKK